MQKHFIVLSLLAPAILISPSTTGAQDLLKEALASFPRQTVRVEYSRLVKLRTLPEYEALRRRFVGSRLQALESSLSQLGIQESDIDELILGWQARGTTLDFEGLASGRFSPQAIADRAVAGGLAPAPVGDLTSYCFQGQTSYCIIGLSQSRGAFGTRESLKTLLETRQGQGASLGSDDNFVKLLNGPQSQAAIWGVAVGPAVGDWFQAWMGNQGSVQLDWSRAFQSVEALIYSVDAGERVRLDVKMDCTSPDTATNLRQVLEGLKLVQQLAWQNQNPNRPNPYEALEIASSGREVSFALTTAYAALEGAGLPSSP